VIEEDLKTITTRECISDITSGTHKVEVEELASMFSSGGIYLMEIYEMRD
jgi:hypothetical protein